MSMDRFKAKLKNRKFLIRFLLLCICLVTLIGAAAYTVFIKPLLQQDKYIYKEDTVTRGDMEIGITESGTVTLGEATVDYDLTIDTTSSSDDTSSDSTSSDSTSDSDEEDSSAIKYLTIEEVEVVAGQRIEAGDPLFKLTQDSVNAVRKILESNETEAEIALAEAKAEYNTSELSAKNTRNSSATASANAGATYQAAMTQINNEVAGYEAAIKVYEQEIATLQEELTDEDMREAYSDSILTYNSAKSVLDETDVHNVAAYTSNYNDYVSAKTTMENYETQISDMEDQIADLQQSITDANAKITEAQNSYTKEASDASHTYESSTLNGQLADSIYEYSTSSLKEEVTAAETTLTEAETALQEFEDFVGTDGIIYATEAGLVTAVNFSAEDTLTETATMLTYTVEDAYTISIDVSEEDIPYLTVGDSVDVIFTAYPDTAYTGEISAITTTYTSDSTATVSYPVTIQILGDTTPLYGGMTADVTFITDSKADALYISKKAVMTENDQPYVYQKNAAGAIVSVPVETGFSNSTSIEITSGLEEGDVVYIASKISGSQDESALMDTSAVSGTDQTDVAVDGTDTDGSFTMPEDAGGNMPGNGTMPGGGSRPGAGN